MTPLDLVELGFAVCEVAAPRPDGACTCRLGDECPSPGKHPIGKAWLARAIRERSSANWERHAVARLHLVPAVSYGLVPMPGSGLLVIDRDDPSVLLPMPDTFEVHRASADPRKGHYYLWLADDISEDEVPRTFAGGEVRVAGSGHVVGPGCRHVSGDLYESNDEAVGIADRELIDALSALRPVRKTTEGEVEAVKDRATRGSSAKLGSSPVGEGMPSASRSDCANSTRPCARRRSATELASSAGWRSGPRRTSLATTSST